MAIVQVGKVIDFFFLHIPIYFPTVHKMADFCHFRPLFLEERFEISTGAEIFTHFFLKTFFHKNLNTIYILIILKYVNHKLHKIKLISIFIGFDIIRLSL